MSKGFFNLQKLADNLSSQIPGDDYVRLSQPKMQLLEPGLKTEYDLLMPWELGIIHPLNTRGKAGHVTVVSDSENGKEKETLKLKLTHPIKIKGDIVIPKCRVYLTVTNPGSTTVVVDRQDYLTFYRPTSLVHLMPTEWFYNNQQ